MSLKNQNNLKKKLDYEDVFCIACRCIYIKPVTMPCDHTLCLECFKDMVDKTAYSCPTCRRRISNWLRKYKHNWDALINENLWKAVQEQFPIEVQKKLNNEDDGLEEIIVGRDFIRVETNKGEVKKEFDSMMMSFQQENEKIELLNEEVAKQLQEEEETQKLEYEKLILEDFKLASALQENIKKELQLEQKYLEKDNKLAKPLQEQSKLTKQGPLDIFFSKFNIQNPKVQCNSKENSLPSGSQSSNTLSLLGSASSSSSYTNPSSSSSNTDSGKILKENVIENQIFDDCTCGRLLECYSNKPLCQFCTNQIDLLDKLIQQKKDYCVAQDLESKFHSKNVEDLNLRKRSSPTQISRLKKSMKLSKGQLTLKQVLQKSFDKND